MADPQRQGQRHEGKQDPGAVSPEAPEHEGREIGQQREEAVGQPASRGTEADRQRAPSLARVELSILEVVDEEDVGHERAHRQPDEECRRGSAARLGTGCEAVAASHAICA